MISFFNRIGNTWVAKVIFGALGVSMMAFWGIGGIGNTASQDSTVLQVGGRKVSAMELNQAFDAERNKITKLTGQFLSPKQAMEMGILQVATQKKLTELLTEAIQEDLGLTASDSAVRKYVERHPAFKDAVGNFDRDLFMAYLSQNNMNDAQVAEQLRNELATQHLSNTIRFAAPTSKMLAEMKWRRQNEQRDVEALLIEMDKIAVNTKATEEELKEYYEAYLSDFMLPEMRDITLLSLTPALVAKTISVSDEELAALYEEQKESYVVPEKRSVLQMRFATKEAAEKMKKELTAANFKPKAIANGQTEEETDFGLVSQAELLPEMGEAVFKLNKNVVSNPIETEIGWHLALVSDIKVAEKPNKKKIYAEIKERLVADAAYGKLAEVTERLEDLLGEGLSLKEAAARLNLSTQDFAKVDMAGEKLPEDLRNQDLMQDVFTLKEKEVSALAEQGNGYLVAEVNAIYPVQAKEFSEVKKELNALWKAEQQKAALPDMLAKAEEQIQSGSIPAKLGQLIVAKKVSLAKENSLPAEALDTVFMQAAGYENAQTTALPNGALISVVKKIRRLPVDEKAMPDQMEQLSADNADTLYNGLVAEYAEKLGVEINTDAIQKAFSVYQSE